jgi:hypothetical protein
MIQELDLDESNGGMYVSPRLTAAGHQAWPALLRSALATYDPSWLQAQSTRTGFWLTHESYTRNGRVFSKAVPVSAAEVLAEGQFVRYYLRAVARRARDDGLCLQVVRLKEVLKPRPESTRLLGSAVDAVTLLESLRQNQGIDPVLGIPAGPNSGLGVRLVR